MQNVISKVGRDSFVKRVGCAKPSGIRVQVTRTDYYYASRSILDISSEFQYNINWD